MGRAPRGGATSYVKRQAIGYSYISDELSDVAIGQAFGYTHISDEPREEGRERACTHKVSLLVCLGIVIVFDEKASTVTSYHYLYDYNYQYVFIIVIGFVIVVFILGKPAPRRWHVACTNVSYPLIFIVQKNMNY